jgi:FtsZ-binding cell division protein ZapB
MAEVLGMNDRLLRKHLHLLCLVGIFRRVRINAWWFNYFINTPPIQIEMEQRNREEIMTLQSKVTNNKERMKKVHLTKNELEKQNEELKQENERLKQQVDLWMMYSVFLLSAIRKNTEL